MNAQYGLKTVGRAFSVLRVIGQAESPLTLSEVAAAAGLSTTIAFRFLHTLEAEGYLRRDSRKRYALAHGHSGELGLAAGMSLLDHIAQKGGAGMTTADLAAVTGRGKGQIVRALETLRAAAAVEFEPQGERWIVASAMIRFLLPLMNDQVLTRLIRPMMGELSASYGETVSWFVPAGWDQVVAEVAPSPNPVRYVLEVGARYASYAGAGGKAQLAAMPEAEVDAWLATLEPVQQTDFVVDPARLGRELREIRARGFAISASERVPGAASAASAVIGPSGGFLGVVSVMMPEYRSSPALLAQIGADISARASRLFDPEESTDSPRPANQKTGGAAP